MFLNLLRQLGQVQLRSSPGRKAGAIIEVIEKMLIRVRAGRSVLRECLKDIQIPLRRRKLMEAPLHHGELVISGSGVAADFYISSKQVGGLFQSLVGDSQIGQLQERFRIIRIRPESLLKQLFGPRVISLALLDVAHVK